jgi:hypothetical protein
MWKLLKKMLEDEMSLWTEMRQEAAACRDAKKLKLYERLFHN